MKTKTYSAVICKIMILSMTEKEKKRKEDQGEGRKETGEDKDDVPLEEFRNLL